MEYTPRLKRKYQEEIIVSLKKEYKSVMQIPKLQKICINQGVGKGSSDKKIVESAQEEISLITGQKAIITKSKKDISNFKLRKGMPVGVMVTLRGDRMYEFLDRLITATLPRVRDFRGISDTGFDGRGNYTLGIKEQIAFPEISIDKVKQITGMDITFVTNTDSDKEALALLTGLGLPFNIKKEDPTNKTDIIIQDKIEEKKIIEDSSREELPVEDSSGEELPVEESSGEELPVEESSGEELPEKESSKEQEDEEKEGINDNN